MSEPAREVVRSRPDGTGEKALRISKDPRPIGRGSLLCPCSVIRTRWGRHALGAGPGLSGQAQGSWGPWVMV